MREYAAEVVGQFGIHHDDAQGVKAYPRIHALTLANIADVQCAQGRLGDACANWSESLDFMSGLKSARASTAVGNIRSRLRAFGPRLPGYARELDRRAAETLRTPLAQKTQPRSSLPVVPVGPASML